ncbi:unnamed protein product [Mytilus coruscus]|uniref:Myb/SANT-like DNA-binding domain-containing protein n=1 Tax=Mytilus coruscus TaxID=42192 RepID=A0A6J8A2J0_MYTCO|nr:unnamed protein product [Mytilus coruscus]
MAELSAKKLPRDRKANFTSIVANLISSRVTNELELLKGRFSTEVTNQKKNEVWKLITEEVNALGVCFRTEAEVRNKYRNMCHGAKEKFTYSRKEMSKTGDGPPPTQLSIAEENIVNAMKDSASFSGVGGIETDITCNVIILLKVCPLSYSIQPTPKKKKTAEDVNSLQCAVLEKELEKNILQIDLLKKLLCKYDNLDSDALELLSVLGQSLLKHENFFQVV